MRKVKELNQMKRNVVEDYRVTWRFCTFFTNKDYIVKQLPILLKNKICSMALDSDMNFYKWHNGKFIVKKFELCCDHESPSGEISINEKPELNKQEKHYLFEVAGMLIHRNMMFSDLDTINTMYMVLEPVYITYNNFTICAYPLLKFRNKMLMIEYRVYPGANEITCEDFAKKFSNIYRDKITSLEMDVNLYHALFPNKEIKDQRIISHDGCEQSICQVPANTFIYLKDISLEIFTLITADMDCEWICRTTYSLKTSFPDKRIATSLLFSYEYTSKYINIDAVTNYREFEDYEHYVSAGATVTLGDIMVSYMFADSLDEEILFNMTQLSEFRSNVETCAYMNDKQLISLYEKILEFKRNYLRKYNHLLLVHKVMNDMWSTYEADQTIEEIETLINLKLKKSESIRNNQFTRIQLFFSVITVLLSSAPLYEYLILPGFSLIVNEKVELIRTDHKILLFLATIVVLSLLLGITQLIFKIKRK